MTTELHGSGSLRVALLAAAAVALSACGGDRPAGTDTIAKDDTGTTSRFNWYLESTTPVGETVIVRSGDGHITNESFIHWNNREYTVNSEIRLDGEGRVVSQRVTGISPFGSPIDERFDYEDGNASWSTTGESGSVTTDTIAHYWPDTSAAFASMPVLLRAAEDSIDGEVPLFPSGSTRVERVTDVTVTTGAGNETLTLYAFSGIEFTPLYAWFDQEGELAAIDFWSGYLGMIPSGWSTDVLTRLSQVQSEASAARISRISSDLAQKLDIPLLFSNVDVVDVETGRLLEDYAVLVSGGKIETLSSVPLEVDGAARVDASGKTLIPGLWDMHGHFGLEEGVLNIAGGIVNVRDIGNVHDKIMLAVEKYASGEAIGPNTYRSGFMDKAGPYASGWAAETLEDALERVDFYAEHGYGQVKLYSSIEPQWVAPIAERTHGHGMRLSGHIPAFMSAEQAVRAGYDEIQHINMVFLNFLVGDQGDTRQQIRFTTYGDEAWKLDLDSEAVESFITLLRDNDVVVDATAAIFDTQLRHATGEPDPTFAAVIDHLPAAIARGLYNAEFVLRDDWPKSAIKQSQMLKKLHDSGVQLVPGSDHYAAFTLHRELEVYSEAGISNADVLKIATIDSARVVGVDDRTGSIAVGKNADLVLLDGNPLDDISAVRRATLVVKGDTVYRPDVLYRAVGVTPFVESSFVESSRITDAKPAP